MGEKTPFYGHNIQQAIQLKRLMEEGRPPQGMMRPVEQPLPPPPPPVDTGLAERIREAEAAYLFDPKKHREMIDQIMREKQEMENRNKMPKFLRELLYGPDPAPGMMDTPPRSEQR